MSHQDKKSICILLGSAHVGGGTYVIFQHALWLQRRGWEVVIVPHFPVTPGMTAWHPEADRELKFATFPEVKERTFTLALATWWRTALDLYRINAKHYGYFVQSIESRFYDDSDLAGQLFAESTYMMGLPVVTEVQWIVDDLHRRFGTEAELAHNGIRKDIYSTIGPRKEPNRSEGVRVLVEGPLRVFFKNVERTVELCRQSKADEIWLMTSTPGLTAYPGVDRVFSCVPIDEAASIYRSCDVLVKLSYVEGMFGPPLEQFHCGGTAIVYEVTGAEEYLKDGFNAYVLKKDDEEGVIQAINRLCDSPTELARLRRNAQETAAKWPDWPAASARFEAAIEALLEKPSPSQSMLKLLSERYSEWNKRHQLQQQQLGALRNELQEIRPLVVPADEAERLRVAAQELQIALSSPTFRLLQRLRSYKALRIFGGAVIRSLRQIKQMFCSVTSRLSACTAPRGAN